MNPDAAPDPPGMKAQVHLWREDGGRRLYAVLHRCAAKGDYWQPVTGNGEPGEEPADCALREAFEETGVRGAPEDLTPLIWTHDWERAGRRFAEHVFGLRCSVPELAVGGEHRAFEWLPYPEALARLAFEGNRRGLALVEEWLNRRPASQVFSSAAGAPPALMVKTRDLPAPAKPG